MRKVFLPCLLVLALGLLGCSQVQQVKQYGSYRSDMWNGKKLLNDGDYKQSLDEFIKAAKSMPAESEPCAFAATASFKLDDVEGASRYVQDAARLKQGDSYMRILGYKSLVLLKQGKEKEGLAALGDFISAYEKEYAPQNVREVRKMWRSGRVDPMALQRLVDDEITIYESDMDQFRTSGNGWFAAKYGAGSNAAISR